MSTRFPEIQVYDSPQSWSIIIHMKTRTVSELNAAYGLSPLPHGLSSAERPFAAAAGFSDPEGPFATTAEFSASERPFATTAEFSAAARNHCCAVMVLNLLLLRFPAYCAGFSRSELFFHVHSFVGNGPVLTLRHANHFLRSTELPGRFTRISSASFVPQNTSGFYALLLAASPFDWHWVLAILPADSCTGDLSVLTGWDSSRLYLWKPNHRSRLLSAWKFDA